MGRRDADKHENFVRNIVAQGRSNETRGFDAESPIMTKTFSRLAACAVALATNTACTPQPSDYAYSTTVRLSDGKVVICDVNESPADTAPPNNGLSVTQERQAEVLATQRLRVLSGPYSPYPTPYTAPIVHCRPAT